MQEIVKLRIYSGCYSGADVVADVPYTDADNCEVVPAHLLRLVPLDSVPGSQKASRFKVSRQKLVKYLYHNYAETWTLKQINFLVTSTYHTPCALDYNFRHWDVAIFIKGHGESIFRNFYVTSVAADAVCKAYIELMAPLYPKDSPYEKTDIPVTLFDDRIGTPNMQLFMRYRGDGTAESTRPVLSLTFEALSRVFDRYSSFPVHATNYFTPATIKFLKINCIDESNVFFEKALGTDVLDDVVDEVDRNSLRIYAVNYFMYQLYKTRTTYRMMRQHADLSISVLKGSSIRIVGPGDFSKVIEADRLLFKSLDVLSEPSGVVAIKDPYVL